MIEEYIKYCQQCNYPKDAGHAKDCSTRNSEGGDMREEGYELFVQFLEKHDIDKMTPEEKVDKIKEMDFDEVMQIVSRINGRLTVRDKVQDWEGKATKSVVGVGAVIELEPPENVEIELEKFYGQMSTNIEVGNVNEWAMKTYFAIIYSHAFGNGNGRTARNVYHLMTEEGIPDKKLAEKRVKDLEFTSRKIKLNAMINMYAKKGITCESYNDLLDYGIVDKDGIGFGSDMDIVKFLAAREVLMKSEYSEFGKKICLEDLSPMQAEEYKRIYAEFRRDLFWSIIEVCDKHKDSIIPITNEITQKDQ